MNGLSMTRPLLLPQLLERTERLFPAVPVYAGVQTATTWAAVAGEARRLAGALQRAGLRPGERVATLLWNQVEHLEACFAVPWAGGVFHPLNPRLSAAELAYIIGHAEDRFLLLDVAYLPLLEAVHAAQRQAGAPALPAERVIVIGEAPAALGLLTLDGFKQGAEAHFHPGELGENDAASMCYTSGTTGRPKGVVYSHRALLLHSLVSSLPDAMNISQRDTVLAATPIFHVNGWCLPYIAAMHGCALALPGSRCRTGGKLPPNPGAEAPSSSAHFGAGQGAAETEAGAEKWSEARSIFELVLCREVTFSTGATVLWQEIARLLREEREAARFRERRAGVGSLRVLTGGSAVPAHLLRELDANGIHLLQGWGMTETAPMALLGMVPAGVEINSDEAYEARARQGIPVPLFEARAVREDGSEAPWDDQTAGELQVRSPWVAAGYFRAEEVQGAHPYGAQGAEERNAGLAGDVGSAGGRTVDCWSVDGWSVDGRSADGWLRTGDAVTVNASGSFRVVDRLKDLIKSGGEWISSLDLEHALREHPGVADAAVVPVPDEKWGERPVAFLELRAHEGAHKSFQDEAPDTLREELCKRLLRRFAAWQLPDRFIVCDKIPRTATGKIRKRELREGLLGPKK